MWDPPGYQPGVHIPGTTVPIAQVAESSGVLGAVAPEEQAAWAAVERDRVRAREQRAANIRAQLAATGNAEQQLALCVAFARTVTGGDQAVVGDPGDLHLLCPAYFPAGWRWNHDPAVLVTYPPAPVARWFARAAVRRAVPTDGAFEWQVVSRWRSRPRRMSRVGWHVGASTVSVREAPCAAWVFPDGSFAVGPVPGELRGYGRPATFAPECLDEMVRRLGLDQPVGSASTPG